MTGSSDRPTLTPCLACGGKKLILEENSDGTYRSVACTWCTQGAMTSEQVKRYNARKKKP